MVAVICSILLGVCDLGEIFAEPEAWKTTSAEFALARRADGFRPVDASGSQVTSLGAGKCVWHGIPLWESRVYFDGNGVKQIELSLYNRGDASKSSTSPMGEAELNDLLAKVVEQIDPGGRPPRVEKRKNRSGGTQSVQTWAKRDPVAELAWGLADDKTVDFVRLKFSTRASSSGKKKTLSGVASAAKVKANVTKNEKGDVWIANVPMVDQGQKGYCAAAVAERVLRYYGHEVDEHQIAQMAGSTAQGGTSVDEMIETVRKVGSACRLGFNQIVSMSGSIKDIKKELELYNKSAKRLKRPELAYNSFLKGNTFMVPAMREAMERDVLFDMRTRDKRSKTFKQGIKSRVDQGVPVFWGVTLGIYPEPDIPQANGGHMRLIIGYNQKTKEILYTDTWGRGHELKRMDEDKAFAITHDAFTLRPL